MSFWKTSDNDNAATTGSEFETGGGNMEPIAAGTQLKAMIDDAKWDNFQDDDFISLRWTVLAPDDYKNRKVFQKVRVLDDDAKKADKAKRMLAAVDANCGGKLAQNDRIPSDAELQQALLNRPMVIEVQVWEFTGDDGQNRSGNWVNKVAPSGKTEPAPAQPQQASSTEGSNDDIPL